MIGQTTGLIFGSLFMNKPASVVFAVLIGDATSTSVRGFLIRVKSLPFVLQLISKLSYFTYLMNGAIVSRYSEEDFNDTEPSHIALDQARKSIIS